MTRANYINRRFGKLVVTELEHRSGNAYFYRCVCDCGNEKIVRQSSLSGGSTQSCGCLRRTILHHNQLPDGEAAFNTFYHRYRLKAQDRGIYWGITKEEFLELTKARCFYCNVEPERVIKNRWGTVYIGNGVDRVDNACGYEDWNCVSCCGTCNRAKGDLTVADFLLWLSRIHIQYETIKEDLFAFLDTPD